MTTPGLASARDNRRMMGKLALFATLMFGFGWAMVPLYNAICEVTGLRILTKRDEGAGVVARNGQVDVSRTITVEFDSNIHGPWAFSAKSRSILVHPGELVSVEYELRNLADRRMAGQAIPSYAPSQAARHFRKVECFCFEQQTLEAHEVRQFPVVFVIDHELPKNVDRITLSYTYFDVGLRGAPPQAPGKIGQGGPPLQPGEPARSGS
jgi:cytochrome c oxidase assembly protein subunit 11